MLSDRLWQEAVPVLQMAKLRLGEAGETPLKNTASTWVSWEANLVLTKRDLPSEEHFIWRPATSAKDWGSLLLPPIPPRLPGHISVWLLAQSALTDITSLSKLSGRMGWSPV